MSTSLETQKALTQTWLGIEAAWDIERNVALRTKDCTNHLLPKSLGHPVRNNAELAEFYGQLKPLWSNYKIDVLDTVHDGEAHKSVVHIMNLADTPVGHFELESIFTLTCTEDGSKLRKVEELVDSGYLNDFLAKLPKDEATTAS